MKKQVTQTAKPSVIDLDALYNPQDTAAWMQITVPTLLALARKKKVPVVRLNQRLLRFCPRTILARAK